MPDIIAGTVVAVGGEVVTLRVDRRHRANEDHYAEAEPVRIRDVLLRRERDGELTAVPACLFRVPALTITFFPSAKLSSSRKRKPLPGSAPG